MRENVGASHAEDGASGSSLPVDPDRFLDEAARISNAYDVDSAVALFAPDAVIDSVAGGTLQVFRGREEIAEGVGVMFGVARRRNLRVAKELIAIDGLTLVNAWTGSIGRRAAARGIEIWRFDIEGRVVEERMLTFLGVRPESSLLQRLRIAISSPVTAVAFLRARLRRG